jgi:hypothetical protein
MTYQFVDYDIDEVYVGYVSYHYGYALCVNYIAPTHSTYYTREDLLRMIDILDGKEEGVKVL